MDTIYKIKYIKQNVTQFKKLIEHSYYLEYKKSCKRKDEIDVLLKDKKTPNKELLRDELKELLPMLKEFKKPWFTNNSPLYDSISTGILILSNSQGGEHEVEITKMTENIIIENEEQEN